LPRVGPDLGIDIAKVAALNPDLVLASLTVPGHERIVEGLERAKLPYLAPEPVSVADVYRDIRTIAARLDERERGERLIAEMSAVLDAPPPDVKPVKVLVEWWPKPVIVPGADSWVTQLLTATGGRNPFEDRPVKSTPITDDEAERARPDAIVISWCGVRPEKYRPEVVVRRPGWQKLDAIKAGRVFRVPEAFLGRPGPRLVDGHRELAKIVAACQSNERFSASSI
jgi:iron complex transport system substrate-binding protein